MKQVTDGNIAERIALLEHAEAETGQLSLHGEYELACLRELRERRDSEPALQQKLDAISAKALELCSEAAQIYQKYNVTQMPDRDLVDHQTIQELSDLIRSGTHDTADKAG